MREYFKSQMPQMDARYTGPSMVDLARAYMTPEQPEAGGPAPNPQEPAPEQQPAPQQPSQTDASAGYGLLGGGAPMAMPQGMEGGKVASSGALGVAAPMMAQMGQSQGGMSVLGGMLAPDAMRMVEKYPSILGLGGMLK